ncbi:MAG: DEAD/DEAH box helicase family protein, partial [Acidimicrobiales bacterium]
NESRGGLVANFEAISVYRSWIDEDVERLAFVTTDFEQLWENTTPNLAVYDFPDAARRLLLRLRPTNRPQRDPEFEDEPTIATTDSRGPTSPPTLQLRDYQNDAVDAWMQADGRGIFAMATGTGKTLTALSLATRVAQAARQANGSLFVLVLCPYQHLVTQWADDARAFGMNPILCFRSRATWYDDLAAAVGDVSRGYIPFAAAIATNATFQTEAFQDLLSRAPSHTLLIADEVHNIGAVGLRACLPEQARYRLGLSATPERWLDEEGTSALAGFFGSTVYEIDIEEAIRRRALTPYEYFPVAVELADDELEVYVELTEQIARLVGDGNINWSDGGDNLPLKQLLFRRARLVATAKNKLSALEEIMSVRRDSSYNLIYCGDGRVEDPLSGEEVRQVDAVVKLLGRKLGMTVNSYTAETPLEEREDLRARFGAGSLQALVAIRCLDEGVDIPETRNALILASSSNPRQFIQRRGRVLRLSPETGKKRSAIWDFVVTPAVDAMPTELKRIERRLVEGELRRVALFARAALNGPQALAELDEVRERYDLLHIG